MIYMKKVSKVVTAVLCSLVLFSAFNTDASANQAPPKLVPTLTHAVNIAIAQTQIGNGNNTNRAAVQMDILNNNTGALIWRSNTATGNGTAQVNSGAIFTSGRVALSVHENRTTGQITRLQRVR